MIDLYYFPTPNTWKVGIMLEECGLPYEVKLVDITKGEQHAPAFLAVSPNNRVPAIVDHDAPGGAQSVFESGAILVYLAEKTGRFLAPSGPARVEALEWLFWQMGGLGPMAGQTHHYVGQAPAGNEYSLERFSKEVARLYGVLERRLADREWIAGDAYGIADMSLWGWVWFHPLHKQSFDDFPAIARWFYAMAERPAVQRGRMIAVSDIPPQMQAVFASPFYNPAPDFDVGKVKVR